MTSSKDRALRYVSDAEPGIRRVRSGRGFKYLHPSGRLVRSKRTLERIRRLAIPPAYRDVWICSDARGHLQATGRDARGRKQYRYHADWRRDRDADKFARMTEFGAALPRLRRRVGRDLRREGLPRNKVLALVVKLLDETLARVGNAEYARSNGSFGLTTLRTRHLRRLGNGQATIVFRGKGGRQRKIRLDDRRLVRIVRELHDLPGQPLFQYLDDEGHRQPIDSTMVNDYLREAMGDGECFTAKDFRTWGATVRAIAHLAEMPLPQKKSARALKRGAAETARAVAESLGNTAAVCRKSYINPVVFTAWEQGVLESKVPERATSPRG
ncbi:MAG TPA: hypothetical protein VLT59_00615, partial [Steroidobacteraceae bacterium]|nr:hypothetical protein [Steroidobacteraceae bacterium]